MIRVNGIKHTWWEGMTIADLLKELDDTYSYTVVRVNEKQVSGPNFHKSVIPDDSEVVLIPMIAGG